jgi:hypothetical protein
MSGTLIESVIRRDRLFVSMGDLIRSLEKDKRNMNDPEVIQFIDDTIETLEKYEEGILKEAGVI